MSDFDLDKFGSSNIFSWTQDQLIRVLTSGHNRVVKNPRLIQALKKFDRADFVPKEYKHLSYNDAEIDIGFDQKLQRPTITLKMIELLQLKLDDRVLDIGTGSGWSAVLMASTVGEKGMVYSIERNQYISNEARENIKKYSEIQNVELIFRDGSNGLPERAPYDAIHIMVTMDNMSDEIKGQLKIGGRLIVPQLDSSLLYLERISKDEWKETIFPGTIFQKIQKGIC